MKLFLQEMRGVHFLLRGERHGMIISFVSDTKKSEQFRENMEPLRYRGGNMKSSDSPISQSQSEMSQVEAAEAAMKMTEAGTQFDPPQSDFLSLLACRQRSGRKNTQVLMT